MVSSLFLLFCWFSGFTVCHVALSSCLVLSLLSPMSVFLIPDRLDCQPRDVLSCKKLCCHSCLSQIRRENNIWWCPLISDVLPCPVGSSSTQVHFQRTHWWHVTLAHPFVMLRNSAFGLVFVVKPLSAYHWVTMVQLQNVGCNAAFKTSHKTQDRSHPALLWTCEDLVS